MRTCLLLALAVTACARDANAPPGADGALAGVWVGSLERDATRIDVALWVEEDGDRLAGADAQQFDPPVPSRPLPAPADLPCHDLERTGPGAIRETVPTDVADVDVAVSLDGETHQLVGEWAALGDGGPVTLTRVAWLATRDDAGRLRALGCIDRAVPECANGLDDDGDGLIDADDPACCGDDPWCALTGNREAADPSCSDGLDNDGDGLADADDPECAGPQQDEIGAEPRCANGRDDDGDGLVDLDDPGCGGDAGRSSEVSGAPADPAAPGCANGFDDDGDGLVDLADPSCHGQANRQEEALGTCDDGIDNDADGRVDVGDDGCSAWYPLDEDGMPSARSDCSDGADDDGDGLTDGADPSCVWLGTGTEVPYAPFPLPARPPDPCTDLRDDPDCAVRDPLADGFTFPDVPACQDGRDDDGDGAADAVDPDCASLFGAREDDDGIPAVECANALDDDGDGLADGDDPDCFAWYDWTEAAACADGRDDDGDGLFDLADPACEGPTDDDEAS